MSGQANRRRVAKITNWNGEQLGAEPIAIWHQARSREVKDVLVFADSSVGVLCVPRKSLAAFVCGHRQSTFASSAVSMRATRSSESLPRRDEKSFVATSPRSSSFTSATGVSTPPSCDTLATSTKPAQRSCAMTMSVSSLATATRTALMTHWATLASPALLALPRRFARWSFSSATSTSMSPRTKSVGALPPQ